MQVSNISLRDFENGYSSILRVYSSTGVVGFEEIKVGETSEWIDEGDFSSYGIQATCSSAVLPNDSEFMFNGNIGIEFSESISDYSINSMGKDGITLSVSEGNTMTMTISFTNFTLKYRDEIEIMYTISGNRRIVRLYIVSE